jgi:phosphoglycolate phosphatase
MAPIDTIIFDIDGTLVDSRRDIVRAVNLTLRRLGLEEKPAEFIISHIGSSTENLMRPMLREQWSALLGDAVGIFRDYFVEHCADESALYPNVREMLGCLAHKGKFVVTNRNSTFAKKTLEKLGIYDCFLDISGADDEMHMKPSTYPIDRLSTRFGFSRSRAIIVGDMKWVGKPA